MFPIKKSLDEEQILKIDNLYNFYEDKELEALKKKK